MSSYPHGSSLRFYCSTTPESAYGTAVADGDFDKEFKIGEVWPDEVPKRTPYNPCGGEFPTGVDTEQWDARVPIRAIATPDVTGWLEYYLFGASYGVAGAGDPYTHTFKKIVAPDYSPASASVIAYYLGEAKAYKFKGGQINSWKIGASIDGEKRLRHEGVMEFDGSRTEIDPISGVECDENEKAYTIGDCAFQFGKVGQAAWSGLKTRSFEIEWSQNLEGIDEVERTGMFIAARDHADRVVRARYSVLGRPGDALDVSFRAGDSVFFNVIATNAVASRVWSLFGAKWAIMSRGTGYSKSSRVHTHEFELLALEDRTDATSIANSPIYSTLQNATVTYAAA